MVAGTGLFLLLGFQPALLFVVPARSELSAPPFESSHPDKARADSRTFVLLFFLLSLRCVQAHRKTTKKPRTPCVPSALSVGRLVFFNILVAGTGLFLFTIFGIKSQLSHFLATFFVVIDIFSTFAIAQGAIRGV